MNIPYGIIVSVSNTYHALILTLYTRIHIRIFHIYYFSNTSWIRLKYTTDTLRIGHAGRIIFRIRNIQGLILYIENVNIFKIVMNRYSHLLEVDNHDFLFI